MQRKGQERKAQEIDAKEKQKVREKQEPITKKKSKTRMNYFMLVIVVGALLIGYCHIMSPTEYTNSIGMEFMLIPAGEFNMGSPSSEQGRANNEGPLHTINIENAYYLGKYEVTQKQWREIMGNNPSRFMGDNLPVEKVSWDDVQEFIIKLNQKEGTDKYRLPSEAEWEYAARAGTTTRFSFGDNESKLGEYAWYYSNSGSKTHPVGQKKSNSWGLYDMHGNVWEWTQDWYHSDYDGAPTDGSVWESVEDFSRVCRGGGWNYLGRSCRSARRVSSHTPGVCGGVGVGFRLLRAP